MSDAPEKITVWIMQRQGEGEYWFDLAQAKTTTREHREGIIAKALAIAGVRLW